MHEGGGAYIRVGKEAAGEKREVRHGEKLSASRGPAEKRREEAAPRACSWEEV